MGCVMDVYFQIRGHYMRELLASVFGIHKLFAEMNIYVCKYSTKLEKGIRLDYWELQDPSPMTNPGGKCSLEANGMEFL